MSKYMDIKEMKQAHKLIGELNYEVTPLDKGYTDKILYINVSDNSEEEVYRR